MDLKKKLISLLLAALTALSLVLPAAAAPVGSFSDVTDPAEARTLETLRLMGVMDGYADGSFRRSASLTRAQFCKMAVYATMSAESLSAYESVTIFPDVKPSHWAFGFINLAARGKSIIAGYPDGTFRPDSKVTFAQAVTILLRLLGYKDAEIGGVWPQSFLALAGQIGLSEGISAGANTPLTRIQAARLFVNLLNADTAEGGSYLASLGTVLPPVMLVASETGSGAVNPKELKTSGGQSYALHDEKATSGVLNGLRGSILLDKNGRAVTFVPSKELSLSVTLSERTVSSITAQGGAKYAVKAETPAFQNGSETTWGAAYAWLHAGQSLTLYLNDAGEVDYIYISGGESSAGAVIVGGTGSTTGFDALTGGVRDFKIVKNGETVTASALRRYDVATYDASSRTVRVSDFRIDVYYEGCAPSRTAPETITALGRTFDVLPTARDQLAKFRPGDSITLLLSDGGAVAGVSAADAQPRGNAVGIVLSDGSLRLLAGSAQILLSGTGLNPGAAVRVFSNEGGVRTSPLTSGVSGTLKTSERTLGGKALSENVQLYRDGETVTLDSFMGADVPSSDILYARANYAGEIDLIVFTPASGGGTAFGYLVVTPGNHESSNAAYKDEWDEPDKPSTMPQITVKTPSGDIGPFPYSTGLKDGSFVRCEYTKNSFTLVQELTELKNVSNSAWVGSSAVNAGGRSYSVPSNVACYSRDSDSWISLSEAHAYADKSTLYVYNGVVRVVVVGG